MNIDIEDALTMALMKMANDGDGKTIKAFRCALNDSICDDSLNISSNEARGIWALCNWLSQFEEPISDDERDGAANLKHFIGMQGYELETTK